MNALEPDVDRYVRLLLFRYDTKNIGRSRIAWCDRCGLWAVTVRVLGGVIEAEFPEWWMCIQFADAELSTLRGEFMLPPLNGTIA